MAAPKFSGKPTMKFCFSPHEDSDLSMDPVADAITNAKSSVFLIAFLYQTKSGPVRQAINEAHEIENL